MAEYFGTRNQIEPDPLKSDLCNGHPTIRGRRITVETMLGFLSTGETREEILNQYPAPEPADIDVRLRFAADLMRHRYTLKSVA